MCLRVRKQERVLRCVQSFNVLRVIIFMLSWRYFPPQIQTFFPRTQSLFSCAIEHVSLLPRFSEHVLCNVTAVSGWDAASSARSALARGVHGPCDHILSGWLTPARDVYCQCPCSCPCDPVVFGQQDRCVHRLCVHIWGLFCLLSFLIHLLLSRLVSELVQWRYFHPSYVLYSRASSSFLQSTN